MAVQAGRTSSFPAAKPVAMAAAAAVSLALTSLPGCGAFGVPLRSCPSLPPPAAGGDTVVVRYLGVGGFLFRHGTDVLLTAPLYSSPSLAEVAADHAIRPDPDQIERLLPAEAAQARAILVGHSHYDHLLDARYVVQHRALGATVYGSTTTVQLLASLERASGNAGTPVRVEALDGLAGDHERPGTWVRPNGAGVRFMALRSEHSPQLTLRVPFVSQPMPMNLWRGRMEDPPPAPPRSASDWPAGTVFSFLIDFLDASGAPLFRAFYQDSGTNEPVGYPPPALLAAKPVDLVILCVGGDFQRLRRYPEGLLARTKPRFVLLGHWEDFFVTQDAHEVDGRVYEIPSADERKTAKFLSRVEESLPAGAQAWLPCPSRSSFEFPVSSSSTALTRR